MSQKTGPQFALKGKQITRLPWNASALPWTRVGNVVVVSVVVLVVSAVVVLVRVLFCFRFSRRFLSVRPAGRPPLSGNGFGPSAKNVSSSDGWMDVRIYGSAPLTAELHSGRR